MANCSYARCIQERRIIKRELQRWTKGMVYIVGLERVAEELMGRRKWKLYQELIARSNQNSINSASTFHQETSVVNQNSAVQQNTQPQQQQHQQERPNIISQQLDDENFISSSQTLLENQLKQKSTTTTTTTTIKCETINIKKEIDTSVTETENQENLELPDDEVTKYIVKIEPKHLENIKNSSIKNNSSIHSIEQGEVPDDDEDDDEVGEKKEEEEEEGNKNKKSLEPSAGKEEEDISELVENQTPNIPIDWKPQEKCYFCVDGKLLTVNENGDLVAESGYSAQTETDIALRQTPVDSDSESSGSYSGSDLRQSANLSSNAAAAAAQSAVVSKTLENLLKGTIPNNMTSLESMAATIQAVAALQGLHSVQGINSLYPGLFYQALAQPQAGTGNHGGGRDDDSVLSMNDSAVRHHHHHHQAAGSSEVTTNAEQPLDLSAKPCASTFPVNETRTNLTSVRAKPRVSTVPGRRTYTEDELQRALQDIISGKLGTRRAAVLYGIPRSTLRNKVYKLSMEQKREALIQPPPAVVLHDDMEEKDVSDMDEDKDIEKDLVKSSNPLALSHLPNHNDRLQKDNDHTRSIIGTPPALHQQQHASPQSQTPPIMHQDLYATNVMLQSLLFQGGLMSQKPEERAVFLQNFVLQQEMLKNAVRSQQSNENQMNNGKPSTSPLDARLFPLLQQKINCKSEPSELVSPHEPNEGDESNVILKIPSFKPIATGGGGGGSGNNIPGTSPGSATSPIIKSNNSNQNLFPPHHSALHLPHHSNNLSHTQNSPPVNSPGNLRPGLSPTLKRENSDSQSPPVTQKNMLTLHEVIASSISKSFQQQSSHHHQSVGGDGDPSKRPQISVIKNLGGTDISRFAHSPNMMSSSSLHASLTGTGGKGTRPKRGKYRNYDRDSLVEAVKAVQRGEMSVHRAGSYYGVPHSTLEYKVKERHLMRPRKREPKPQPLDGGGGTSSSTASSSTKDISASNTFRPVDKSKSLAQQQQQQQPKPLLKTPPPQFSSPSPNGMKMPIFDPAMAAIQYTSQLLWPHPPGGFTSLPMDFPRPGPGSAAAQFASNPEQFFATQMMQKFQENSSKMQLNKPPANNLYDVTNSNGSSLLDGIIRQSLDRGKNEMSHSGGGGGGSGGGGSSLLDQLSKSNCSSSVASDDTNSNNGGTKRSAGSPLNYSHIDIKRERSSPITTSESDRDTPDSDDHISDATMQTTTAMNKGAENLLRIREDLTLRSGSADEQQHQPPLKRMEDHNGGGGGGGVALIPNSTATSQQSDMDDGT